jgi:hypothetical protein
LCTEPKIWTCKVIILSRSYTAFFVLHSGSCYWQNHFVEYPSKIWTFTKSSSAHAVILIIVLVFILKNHFIVLVLISIRSRLIMTKTCVHWTEDMIQSRHRLAQLYGILRIALRSCYWQNQFYWVLVLFTNPFMDNSGTNRR